jgi:hypothetical protein
MAQWHSTAEVLAIAAVVLSFAEAIVHHRQKGGLPRIWSNLWRSRP